MNLAIVDSHPIKSGDLKDLFGEIFTQDVLGERILRMLVERWVDTKYLKVEFLNRRGLRKPLRQIFGGVQQPHGEAE